jgi:hypothetical protein
MRHLAGGLLAICAVDDSSPRIDGNHNSLKDNALTPNLPDGMSQAD